MQKKQLLTLVIIFLVLFSIKTNGQQTTVNAGVGAVAEIVVPAQTNMQSNFNLMYQVQFSRKDVPVPSFWYKIVFGDSCSFQFSLFPLNEKDRYDFYLYKINDNYNFCSALGEDKIVSCDSYKTKPTTAESGVKANLIGVSAIKVNAGDAIYVEVMSIKGWDGGHMFDFRSSDSSSFVVKVENTYKDTTRTDSNAVNIENTFKNISNKEIQDVFCKTLSAVDTEPYHLLYSKNQAMKDSITFFNNKNKIGGANAGGNNSSSGGALEAESKINVKSKSTIAIFNAIKNKPISKAKNPVYLENYIPEKGVIYKVQVGFFMSQTPHISIFKGLSPVFQEKLPMGIKYSVGAFSNYELATVGKSFVRSLGMEDAFVIAYYNGKRVTIAEAQSHEKE